MTTALRTLHLDEMDEIWATKATQDCFPSLERLIIDSHCYIQDSKPLQQILSPCSMPRLVHLACEFQEAYSGQNQQSLRLFASLLPQVWTLAVKARYFGDVDPVGSLATCSSLKHLSIESYETNIFVAAAGLNLTSLHMSSNSFKRGFYKFLSIERLVAVANGLKETFRCEKVILHGGRKTTEEKTGVADLGSIEFSKCYSPPFEEFHGNYT